MPICFFGKSNLGFNHDEAATEDIRFSAADQSSTNQNKWLNSITWTTAMWLRTPHHESKHQQPKPVWGQSDTSRKSIDRASHYGNNGGACQINWVKALDDGLAAATLTNHSTLRQRGKISYCPRIRLAGYVLEPDCRPVSSFTAQKFGGIWWHLVVCRGIPSRFNIKPTCLSKKRLIPSGSITL